MSKLKRKRYESFKAFDFSEDDNENPSDSDQKHHAQAFKKFLKDHKKPRRKSSSFQENPKEKTTISPKSNKPLLKQKEFH